MTESVVEDANDRGMGARQGTYDAPFGASIRPDGSNLDQHPVAVHGRPSSVWRNENIACEPAFETCIERSGFGNHEAEAIAMHRQTADEQVASLRSLRNGVTFRVDLQQFTFSDQRMQPVSQRVARF